MARRGLEYEQSHALEERLEHALVEVDGQGGKRMGSRDAIRTSIVCEGIYNENDSCDRGWSMSWALCWIRGLNMRWWRWRARL